MVYWATRRTYVAVVAGDPKIRGCLKQRLAPVAEEVATFPDDSALLPELDRLTRAERDGGDRYRKVLVVKADRADRNRGMTTAYWARPHFDTVVVLGTRPRHWPEAIRACRADTCLSAGAVGLPGRVAALAAQA